MVYVSLREFPGELFPWHMQTCGFSMHAICMHAGSLHVLVIMRVSDSSWRWAWECLAPQSAQRSSTCWRRPFSSLHFSAKPRGLLEMCTLRGLWSCRKSRRRTWGATTLATPATLGEKFSGKLSWRWKVMKPQNGFCHCDSCCGLQDLGNLLLSSGSSTNELLAVRQSPVLNQRVPILIFQNVSLSVDERSVHMQNIFPVMLKRRIGSRQQGDNMTGNTWTETEMRWTSGIWGPFQLFSGILGILCAGF